VALLLAFQGSFRSGVVDWLQRHSLIQRTKATPFGWTVSLKRLTGAEAPGFGDGSATEARFSDPFGLAIDPAGRLLIADAGDNNRIRMISPNGLVTTIAGSEEGFADGSGEDARFHTPSGLAIDRGGNIFVADTGNNAIRRITPQGTVSTLAGNGKAGHRDGPGREAQFNGPLGVAVDHAGNVYVADTYNDRIRMISPDGQVSTLAGGNRPGYQDGTAALFDTPCTLVVDATGTLYVADTGNNAIRKLTHDGRVSTVARALPDEREALLRRPVGLALTHDGYLYVGETSRGRIVQISPGGEIRGLTGADGDLGDGNGTDLRLKHPAGLALAPDGGLYVSDSFRYAIRRVMPQTTLAMSPPETSIEPRHLPPPAPTGSLVAATSPWPVEPRIGWHEIVGTMGEVRGNYDGESRDHFHAGVDVQADMGAPVFAVRDEKVRSPLPNWGYAGLNEGIRLDSMIYVHLRVGRTPKDVSLDPARFELLSDEAGKPARVRVKRGIRVRSGEVLGTVNRMYHVHLEFSPDGTEVNPLVLAFNGIKDRKPPRIESIRLFDQAGQRLTQKHRGRLLVARVGGDVRIVVGAYDQMDGNLARRRLGLYKLGYQVLQKDGSAASGFEHPLINLEFNRLPADKDAVKVAYAESSGTTAHGNAATRFHYVVTNRVRDGSAKTGSWRPADLPRGDYILRIIAADYAGNEARNGRDVPITIE